MLLGKKHVKRFIRRAKGFTLVELLIVIVVIGVLSAMMMLSSTEAVSSARANNIISNLHNWKTAALEWYTDNIDKVNAKGWILKDNGKFEGKFQNGNEVGAKDIIPYLGGNFILENNQVKDSSGGIYYADLYDNRDGWPTSFCWLIIYKIPVNDAGIKSRLEAKAKSLGLIYINEGTKANFTDPYTAAADKELESYVGIKVIDFKQK